MSNTNFVEMKFKHYVDFSGIGFRLMMTER